MAKGRPRPALARAITAATLALICLVPLGSAIAAQALLRPGEQATAAAARLDSEFYYAREGLYRVQGGAHEPEAALWPTSQILAGAIAVARITHAPADLDRVRRIIASLQHFDAGNGVYHARVVRSLRYYDDNNWIALDLLDAAPLLNDQTLVTRAKRIFTFLVSGWDAAHGGGILWADGHGDRPTVSTAPAITIGLRLAAITHDPYYKTWAQRFYQWENTRMRAPGGLFWDHIQYDGKMDRDLVSYNQGAMIDANVAYAALTHQQSYLAEAKRIADAAARAFPGPWRNRGNYAAFDAIYFQSLGHLNAAAHGAANLKPVQDYVAWEWPRAQGRRAGLTESDLLEQAAFVLSAATVAG